jgi:RNA polymerase sigma-70 factor, ECF subfamily
VDPDGALVEAAASGSREAFDELVRRHQTAIVALVRALTAGGDEAEDLAQEAFVRAWRSLRSFRGDSAFRTWLHRVAINVVRTSQTRRTRLLRIFVPFAGPAPDGRSPDLRDADEPVDEALSRRQIVERALSELPDDLRVAVTLRDLQGLDYKEIAGVLGVPIGTVESRIFRARQRLKPLLASLIGRSGDRIPERSGD